MLTLKLQVLSENKKKQKQNVIKAFKLLFMSEEIFFCYYFVKGQDYEIDNSLFSSFSFLAHMFRRCLFINSTTVRY